jgi:threonine/homoserine/homoserine lactone efflux protein
MFIQGLIIGFSLSLLVGPMLFAIIHASLERGFRAGISVASGIWVSDLMFLAALYHGLGPLSSLIALPNFKLWAGLAGGVVLFFFGITTLVSRKSPDENKVNPADRILDTIDGKEPDGVEHNWKTWGFIGYWVRGFLLNTINPFTIFFWLGIASAFILPNNWAKEDVFWFFAGILSMLICCDALKAYGAKRLRDFLTPDHVRKLQRVIGLLLLVFGVILVIRVLS